MQNKLISDIKIAAYTATLKNPKDQIKSDFQILDYDILPKSGDLVVAHCKEPCGAYDSIEYGITSKYEFKAGDLVVLVLGNRSSSTHIYGIVPEHKLKAGDMLDLLSGAGMAGKAINVPSRFNAETTQFQLIGFISKDGKKVLNTLDYTSAISKNTSTEVPCIFIGGSSAQVGKTTFARKLIKAIKHLNQETKISVIKATGTGSAKYHELYKEAGADFTMDYVEFGHPSTYGMDINIFAEVMRNMLARCSEVSDLIIIELGGDLYEANCPEAVNIASELDSEFIFVTNDAMGAKEGLRFLESAGIEKAYISSFRQNLYSLAQRLSIPMERVVDMDVEEEMKQLSQKLI
jgi:Ni2+-binding GTPase involved in maturation of urease and hydrogenase